MRKWTKNSLNPNEPQLFIVNEGKSILLLAIKYGSRGGLIFKINKTSCFCCSCKEKQLISKLSFVHNFECKLNPKNSLNINLVWHLFNIQIEDATTLRYMLLLDYTNACKWCDSRKIKKSARDRPWANDFILFY